MNTPDFNHKDLRPVMKCDAELNCTAAPQLAKAVAEELDLNDQDIERLLKADTTIEIKETPACHQAE